MRGPGQSGSEPVPAGSVAPRLALVYVALFSMMGIQLPYWPVWLADRGMGAEQIGVLLGVFTWARLAAPWAGSWADRRGRGGHLACALAGATLACFAGFVWADGFAPLLLLSAALGLALAPILPLADGIAVSAAAAGRIDYGRVRLWGSVAFVLASGVGGLVLQRTSPDLVLTALLITSVALLAATAWLAPAGRKSPVSASAPAASLGAILRWPRFLTFLAAGACMQGAHAVLYGFGTRHWQAIGITESTIGWLWAWGVIAEVVLFAVGQRMVARFSPPGMLALAALGGIVRWPLLAWVESVEVVVLVQTLHAATFAAAHMGAMSWIRDSIGREGVQRATALYTAVCSGASLGLGMPLAGVLFDRFAGGAYLAMAATSTLGLFFALRLRRP
jgi:MFS transporter, PPP family, 3-phenylpropionic acid transporter